MADGLRRLRTPLCASDVLELKAGELVCLEGTIFTARDKAHALMVSRGPPVSLEGAVLYHSGPLIRGQGVVSAGPTTSGRLTRYLPQVLSWGVRAMVGKGGLPGAVGILRGRAVYLAYPGGCGASAAAHLTVKGIHLRELGMAEALWEMDAMGFGPMVVAIDAHGRDLYEEVRESVKLRFSP